MTAPWPQDRTDTLIRLWNGGTTSGEIARQLGITRNMVMGKVSRLQLLRHARLVNYSPKVSKPTEKRPPTPLKPQEIAPYLATYPVPFIAATDSTCRWPLWNGPKTGKVCGAKPVPAAPYCPYHYDKAFTGLWSRRKTA